MQQLLLQALLLFLLLGYGTCHTYGSTKFEEEALLQQGGSELHHGRSLLQATPTSGFVVDGVFAAMPLGGPGAMATRVLQALDPTSGARYVIVSASNGSFAYGAVTSLATPSLSSANPAQGIESLLVYRIRNDSQSSVAWSVNLQATATAAQYFAITSVAVNPATGDLVVAGEFAGLLAFGRTVIAANGIDGFVAEVAAADGSVTWAQPYGGAGRDSVLTVAFSSASSPKLYALGAFDAQGALIGSQPVNNTHINSVNPRGLYLAALGSGTGDATLLASFDVDAMYVDAAEMLLAADGSFSIALALPGSAALYLGSSQASIGAGAAGIVLFALAPTGVPVSASPLVVQAASAGAPELLLSVLALANGTLYLGATFHGQASAGNLALGATNDSYSDGLVLAVAASDLSVSWWVLVGGPGSQSLDGLALQPNNSAIYAMGGAWSSGLVAVAAAQPGGAANATASFVSQLQQSGQGAYIMPLLTATGAPLWAKLFDGWQDQGLSGIYSPGPSQALIVTGLYDRNTPCKTFEAGQAATCAEGPRPAFSAVLALPPRGAGSGTALSTQASPVSSGSNTGTLAGSIAGGIVGVTLIALACYFAVKRTGGLSFWHTNPTALGDRLMADGTPTMAGEAGPSAPSLRG